MLAPNAISLPGTSSPAETCRAASSAPSDLAAAFAALDIVHYHAWAWTNYKRIIADLSRQFSAHRLIEIGGGRDPLFNTREIADLGVEMTINDIAPGELGVLPPEYQTACFDVAGNISSVADLRNTFDLAFSRMVFEHVADGQRAWTNLYELLAPGGVGLAFVPTLYALPFVLNWMLPPKVAAAVVKLIYHHRTDSEDPIFPAHYSWCFADTKRLQPMLSAIGYREVVVQPFYGHGYYRFFPVIRDIHERFTSVALKRDWRAIASFAYIAARK